MAVSSLSQETKNKLNEAKASTTSAANDAKGKIQELPSSAAQQVENVASDVSHKAQEWAAAAVDKTNDGIAVVGHQMTALGGTVRETAPQNGVIGSAATTVANQVQAGGHYLEEHGLGDMGKDLTAMIRHYPIRSVLVGFGLGCMLGMTLLRRS